MKTHEGAALHSPWKRQPKIRHTEPCNQAQSGIMRLSLFFLFSQTPELLHLILIYWRQFYFRLWIKLLSLRTSSACASGLNSFSSLDLQEFGRAANSASDKLCPLEEAGSLALINTWHLEPQFSFLNIVMSLAPIFGGILRDIVRSENSKHRRLNLRSDNISSLRSCKCLALYSML